MDGWGIAPHSEYNAITNARTPNFDRLVREYPNVKLKSDGSSVGLPDGQFGTSEVNHLIIGAGRVILQDLPKINNSILDGTLQTNEALNKSIAHAIKNQSRLHLVGILSDGGVHSHISHMFEIIRLAKSKDSNLKIFLHLFTDGRDVAPFSAEKYFKQLDSFLVQENFKSVEISTIQGRVFLDRDRDWAKTEQAFRLLYDGDMMQVNNWKSALNLAYNLGVSSDEKIGQYIVKKEGQIKKNDAIIFTHFRTDRIYQLLKRILNENIPNLQITTLTKASEEFESHVDVAFPRNKVKNTLAEVVSKAGKTQLHITETEKYPHLTFFLNGEREEPFPLEEWKLIESNRFVKPNYDLEPSMQNFNITKEVLSSISKCSHDLVIVNLCSPDMVGHTGNFHAAVVSAESVDFCVGRIYEEIKKNFEEYALIVTADHGNSDIMWDTENNQPHTQHTNSPVPFILVSNLPGIKLKQRESLQDVAPTILELMKIPKPEEMEGESLISVK